nr:MAG TPA: scarabaecin peptide, antimicrobial peptide, beetle [Caudoviricetes sp.]
MVSVILSTSIMIIPPFRKIISNKQDINNMQKGRVWNGL